jgi:hypothetical protein
MAQLVDLLFADNLVKKLEWMADEGAALDKVNEKVTACTDPAQKVLVFGSNIVQTMMVSLCNDAEMINFVLTLGGDWAKWKPWAQAEGAPLNNLAIAAMIANKITEPTLVGFIRVIQSGGSATTARDYIRNLNDADLATLKGSGVPQDVITEVWGSDADPVTRALNGEIFTGEQSVTNAETLLTGPTTSPFVAMNFGDDHRFNITYNRDGVDVNVDVKLTPVDDRATELLPAAITTWSTNISNAWNNQFNITNGQRTIPIRFHVNLGNSGSNEVNIHSGQWVWPNLNAGNWFVPDTVNQPGQAAAVATAPVHEFGHLIGNLDEYNISAAHYLTVVGTPAATDPNAVGQTDTAGTTRYTNVNSVMGQGGPALSRHVTNILNYVNSNLRTGEPVFTFAP